MIQLRHLRLSHSRVGSSFVPTCFACRSPATVWDYDLYRFCCGIHVQQSSTSISVLRVLAGSPRTRGRRR